MDMYTFTISISRKGAVAGASLIAAALVVSTLLGVGSSADAAGAKRLCVKGSKVVQRTTCKSSERNVAAGKLTSVNKPVRTLDTGTSKMRTAIAGSSADGTRTAVVSGQTFDTTTVASQGVIAVTERLVLPAGWTGRYEGACPAYAPLYTGSSNYMPDVEVAVAAFNLAQSTAYFAPWYVDWDVAGRPGQAVFERDAAFNDRISSRYAEHVAGTLTYSDYGAYVWNPANPLTIYVTQLCAPIVDYVPAK